MQYNASFPLNKQRDSSMSVEADSVSYFVLYILSCRTSLSFIDPVSLLLFYSCPIGPSGAVITMTGTGFGTDSQHVSVTINDVPCNVSAVSDTEVQCTAGENPGGRYPVMLHHHVKGYAQSDAVFTYELLLIGVQPNQGKPWEKRLDLKG